MALYTLKSEDEVMNQANNSGVSNGLLALNPRLQLFNSIGPTTSSGGDGNFFTKKGKSLENAFGTTGAALVSGIVDKSHQAGTEKMLEDNKAKLEDIAKKYGYGSLDDYYDKIQAAEDAGDADTVKSLESTIGAELKAQAKSNADAMDKRANGYEDYRKNNYISQKINQDEGKFLGSAINTLSTMSDVMLPGAGVAFNAVQGGVEGIADELEQNGFKNFDWERAGQNALTGAVTGLATGAVNKGISNALAKRGGNLLKGGNKVTQAINKFNSNNPVGQLASSLGTGAARGAVSGAVGGATGAGLSAAMNGQDVLGSALQGAVQGAQQGATTGGIMAGANMALSKTPGVGNVMRQLNEAGEDWNNRKARGEDFNQRLTGTLTSGDSAVGEWLQGNKKSGALNRLRNIGGTLDNIDANGKIIYHGTNASFEDFDEGLPSVWFSDSDQHLAESGMQGSDVSKKINVIKRRLPNDLKIADDVLADKLTKQQLIDRGYEGIAYSESGPNGDETYYEIFNPNKTLGKVNDNQTPTTLGGWLKKAGKRVVEDVNNIAPGMIVKDVSGDGMLNMKPGEQLPLNAKLKTLSELTDGQYKTIGDMMNDGLTLDDIKAVLPKSDYEAILQNAREVAEINNPLEQINQYNDRVKSKLPQLNRDEWYEDTLGSVKNRKSAADIPDYMQSHLSNKVTRGNDEILRDYFMDNGIGSTDNTKYTQSELYELYDRIASGPNANEIYTPENIEDGMALAGNEGNRITTELANRLFNGKKDIKVEGRTGRAKNVPVTNNEAVWDATKADLQEDAVLNMLKTLPEEYGTMPTSATSQRATASKPVSMNLPENRARDLSGDGMVSSRRTVMPDDIKSMRINDGTQLPPETGGAGNTGGTPPRNPATELYDSLNRQPQEPIDLTNSFGDKGLGSIEQRNKLQALGQQLQNSAKTQKYAPIYDSLDARTAKRAAETNAPQQLADLGVKPQDYNEYAKTSSYVNRVVSDLAKKSGIKVNAPDLPTKLSADNIDVVMSDSALKKYNGYIKQIVPDGDSPTQYSASYLLEKSRELGNKAANLRGNTDDVSALRQALTDAKYTLRDIATNALEGSLVTGDATNDMIAQGLKNLGANEKVQDYYTEAVDGKAPSVSDYIRRSSLFEQARDMGTQVDAEKYTRSASKAPTRFATKVLRASGLEQPIETLLRNTVAPIASGITNAAGKAIEGAGNIVANRGGSGGAETTTMPASTNASSDYNPSTRLYNAIGRTEGAITRDNARNGAYLAEAAQEAEVVPDTMMQTASIPTTDSSTALYNSVTGIAPAQTATTASTQGAMPSYGSQSEEQATYFFPPTGDYWSDMLSQAMRRAKNAGDYDALGQLFEMYQTQANKLEKQAQSASTSTKSTKLTDTQRRANAAMNSLDRISTMTPDLGYNLSGIPVIGDIATWGGNDYESEAKSLAQQIGYMLSGANIKEEEAYNIGKAYVPQPFDSEQTRKSKLQRAYDIIQQYQNGYAE